MKICSCGQQLFTFEQEREHLRDCPHSQFMKERTSNLYLIDAHSRLKAIAKSLLRFTDRELNPEERDELEALKSALEEEIKKTSLPKQTT